MEKRMAELVKRVQTVFGSHVSLAYDVWQYGFDPSKPPEGQYKLYREYFGHLRFNTLDEVEAWFDEVVDKRAEKEVLFRKF